MEATHLRIGMVARNIYKTQKRLCSICNKSILLTTKTMLFTLFHKDSCLDHLYWQSMTINLMRIIKDGVKQGKLDITTLKEISHRLQTRQTDLHVLS